SGVDIEQIVCALNENINYSAFDRAWQTVLNRHAILRTSFKWEGLPEPVQVVHPDLSLPLKQIDWRSLSQKDQEDKLKAYLEDDRRQGFDLTQAPLLHLALYRTGETAYKFIWTFHHALLDGRSYRLILREAFTLYEAFARNEVLPLDQPRPYWEYIEWS